MAKALIIVESPAKIKTLKKFLGSDYLFESSLGHIRDLPEKEFGIDIEQDFTPKYVVLPDKELVIARLKKAAKQCERSIFPPTPTAKEKPLPGISAKFCPQIPTLNASPSIRSQKMPFLKHSNTPERSICPCQCPTSPPSSRPDRRLQNLPNPQPPHSTRERRYPFPPAASNQSPLNLVVDREKEIEAFKPVEYWNLAALSKTRLKKNALSASLYSVDTRRVEKEAVEGKDLTIINNKDAAEIILERMKGTPYQVLKRR